VILKTFAVKPARIP